MNPTEPIKKKGTNRIVLVILFLVAVLILWGCWRVMVLFAIIPIEVDLPSGIFVPAPAWHTSGRVEYDPSNPPPAPEVIKIVVDRSNKQAVFYTSSGETIPVSLGRADRVLGCEKQFSMKYYPLEVEELRLGALTFHQPSLVSVCEMWSRNRTITPDTINLMEGPLQTSDTFPFLVESSLPGSTLLTFGKAYGTLHADIVDGVTGQPLPDAHILLISQAGIQEATGSFTLPLYAKVHVEYRISAPGYPERQGQINNIYENMLSIEDFPAETGQATTGYFMDLPAYGQDMNYSFQMGVTSLNPSLPTLTPVPLPTGSITATPVP